HPRRHLLRRGRLQHVALVLARAGVRADVGEVALPGRLPRRLPTGEVVNPSAWAGLAFVTSAQNAHLDTAHDCIRMAAPHIACGQRCRSIDPALVHAKRVIADCAKFGMTPSGWAWCDGPNVEGAQAEARYHAQTVLDLGLNSFVCNMEEPYDAHGDQSSPRWQMANAYAQAFRQVAGQIEFAVTTTPHFASDGTGLRQAGAVIMPQC